MLDKEVKSIVAEGDPSGELQGYFGQFICQTVLPPTSRT